jgi:predicted membrane-bound mannosyltransferase
MEQAKVARQTITKARVGGARGLSRRAFHFWHGWTFGWFGAAILAVVLLALGMRLWELGGRAMHYDEGIHVHYAWRLFESEGAWLGWPWVFGTDFIHSPWMHGPFQFELTALVFRLFGDSDFTSRLVYALFGAALVGLPYFLRDYLGRAGAMLAAVMLALSPSLLYFSRFGRNDILMAFWAASILVLMWRYIHEGKDRYLYLASAVLAFMFATKETAYMVALILGAMMFLPALTDLVPWALGRTRLSRMAGPAGFLLLLVTLTLPQWAPMTCLAQGALGLTLCNAEGVTGGLVGAPHWAGSFVNLPVYDAPWWLHGLASGLLVAGLTWISSRTRGNPKGSRIAPRRLITGVAVPLAVVAATLTAVFRPIDQVWSPADISVPDFVVPGVLTGLALGALAMARHPWRQAALLILLPALAAVAYAFWFTNVVDVDAIVNGVLPGGINVDASANAVPVNFLVAGALLLGAFALSIYLGVRWLGGRWLLCAGIFYFIWAILYTTLFTNLAGAFSGVWQGMGYWYAQQDVARGNQPWYYYFVGLSVYELLPVIFGVAAAVYFLKKGDVLGLALAFWASLTFAAYTIASEKMPWLLVNVTLPFIWLSAKYLGELAERVRWRDALRRGYWVLLFLPPMAAVAAVYLVYSYANPEDRFSTPHWALMGSTGLLLVAAAYLVRLARPHRGMALAGLGLAGLMLGFGAIGAVRATYTYDDSNVEMLVYAQGSQDVREAFRDLKGRVFDNEPTPGAVKVDYDLWYPLQWYVRHESKENTLKFFSFPKEEDNEDTPVCDALPDEPNTPLVLLTDDHANRNCDAYAEYEKVGPSRNLLWFYEEAYRRPGENRQDEGVLWGLRGIPSEKQVSKDFGYFKSVATDREAWFDALDYLIFRNLDANWYDSKFYSYLPP